MAADVTLSPLWNGLQFFGNTGLPLSGGLLRTCVAGSFTVNRATFSTSAGDVINPNPIVLTSAGRLPVDIWLLVDVAYNLVLTDALGNVLDSVDNVVATAYDAPGAEILTETVTSEQDQTVFNLENPYVMGSSTLLLSVNGAIQVLGADYSETSTTSVTFSSGLNENDVLQAVVLGASLQINSLSGYLTSSDTPLVPGQITLETPTNTTVVLKLKGSDNIIRSVTLTLA